MYTGLIGRLGSLRKIVTEGESLRLDVETSPFVEPLQEGDLVSLSGFGLAVEKPKQVSGTMLRWRTRVSDPFAVAHISATWSPGSILNIERATLFGDELGGNFVFGEPSLAVTVMAITKAEERLLVRFRADSSLTGKVAKNCGMALDGIAMTAYKMIDERTYDSVLNGQTRRNTSFVRLAVGDRLALEPDVLLSPRIAPKWPGKAVA
ncbi:MAG: hypothetical protein AAFY02_13215 [Pseudomonadota bacterium]